MQKLDHVDSFKDEYEMFSNFYPITVQYEDVEYPSVEHAFVAAKSNDVLFRKMVAEIPADEAGAAKRKGRNKKLCKLRPNWDLMKISVMRKLLTQKFGNTKFRRLLLSTGQMELIEGNYWHDNYWGDCYCKKCKSIKGQNNLGKLLMKIRFELALDYRVLITGDIHNLFNRLNQLINQKNPDLIICCGDFGFWPLFAGKSGGIKPLSSIKLQGAEKLLWIDGNHEDHWELAKRESDEIEPGIIYMPRGSTYTLPDGRVILFMGGANSIDKMWRTIGHDWFPEELITQKDFMNLPDCEVDIFITHTCPNELVLDLKTQYIGKEWEPSNHALSELWKIYKPDLWFFGHWHTFLDITMMGTKCYCLSHPGEGRQWWMWLPRKR